MAQDDLYREAYRPQFHFTARQWDHPKTPVERGEDGWANDPNGLMVYQGEYHLFFQRWGQAWGHAVGTDLIHWTEIRPAIHIDADGMVASGSGAIDWPNTLGLNRPGEPAMIIFYTSWTEPVHRQCLAFSTDRGRTWIKHPQNPILRRGDRDPKVFWHEPTQRWCMILYDRVDDEHCYIFFSSTDLFHWEEHGRLPGFFECPDFFQLPVDGDPSRLKWFLVDGSGIYVVGEFDGRMFRPETKRQRVDFGPNFYATQSWNEMPKEDGRRVQIAWLSGGRHPGMPFSQALTFPCELRLRELDGELRLCREPVREIALLREATVRHEPFVLKDTAPMPLWDDSWDLVEFEVAFEPGNAREVGVDVHGQRHIRYDTAARLLWLQNAAAPLDPVDGLIRLRVLIDRTSVEVFANGGRVSLTGWFWYDLANKSLALWSWGGSASVRELTVHRLRSVWFGGEG